MHRAHHVVAVEKDRDNLMWFIAGVLFGPLALVAAAGVPDLSEEEDDEEEEVV